jgi:hypothetical protein
MGPCMSLRSLRRSRSSSAAPDAAVSPGVIEMSWRDHLKIHPAADLFPLMSPEDLQALADDIKVNEIRVPPELLVIDDEIQLIDGRNRLDAMELAGYTFEPSERPQLAPPKAIDPADGAGTYMDWHYRRGGTKEVDPNELVVSLNIHR